MYIQQGAPASFPLSFRLQAIFATLIDAVKIISADNNMARSDISASSVDPHLQYDIGEIDYDPRLIRSFDHPSSYEHRLWLHHYPR